jgi:hypothetical protein
METVFVKAVFDIDCEWSGTQPVYRVFVNDELFTERTWLWQDAYLEEILQIQALPGKYRVQLKPVHSQAKFTVSNHRIEHGPAHWIDDQHLEITHESQ